jgi:ribonucleoside-triphosphate reductase
MTPRADLADVVFFSKYARFLPEKARRETYDEAVSRVMGMHRSVFADAPDVVQQDLGYAEEFLRRKMVLGSQRVMQYAGAGVLKNNARGYNCAFSFCDRERFFAEAFWLLLSGCGVGFSVQEHHVAKLNPVMRPSGTDVRVVVRDSIEGWADAADALIRSYLVTGAAVSFDFSEIRPGTVRGTGRARPCGREGAAPDRSLRRDDAPRYGGAFRRCPPLGHHRAVLPVRRGDDECQDRRVV